MKGIVEFENKYGEKRTIHRDSRGRLAISRNRNTVILSLTKASSVLIGKRIKEARIAAGLTLSELGRRAGMEDGDVKGRIFAIENASDGRGGFRMGTLVAIALALGVPLSDLIPKAEEIAVEAGVSKKYNEALHA